MVYRRYPPFNCVADNLFLISPGAKIWWNDQRFEHDAIQDSDRPLLTYIDLEVRVLLVTPGVHGSLTSDQWAYSGRRFPYH